LLHNFTFFCSYNSHINHAVKFKYQPGQFKVNKDIQYKECTDEANDVGLRILQHSGLAIGEINAHGAHWTQKYIIII